MIEKLSVKKPYTILVGVCLIFILGIVSFTRMTSDLMPNISLPYVIVMTTYVGASPETVEMVVTKPVEAQMATVSNIENISSISSENYSLVILEFAQSANMDSVSLELREKIDQIKPYWDDSVGNPIIMKLNPDMMPVMISAVGGKEMSYSEISELVTGKIVPELESIEGVASVSTSGLLEESVHVIIRQEKIDAINQQVFGFIAGEMADAEKQLAEGRDEILDGQAKLEEAQQGLDDTRKELADGKREILSGQREITNNKSDLEEGREELEKTRDKTIAELAAAEKQLLTGKASLEAAKIQITTNITAVKGLAEGLSQAQEGQKLLEQAIQLFEGLALVQDGIAELSAGIEMLELLLPGMAGYSLNDLIGLGWDPADFQDMLDAGYGDIPLSALLVTLQATLDDLKIQEASLTYLASQVGMSEAEVRSQKATVDATIPRLTTSLHAATMGMTADQYLAMMESQQKEIDKNLATVDEAIIELSKGNLTAAIEFANGQTMISIGEMQLSGAEAQLEAALKQLEAGEEQLESGQETINDSLEALKEALEQVSEGEEKLAQAKEDAFLNADMHGILTVETIKGLLAAQNFSMPGGYVTEAGIDYLIRIGDKPDDVAGLKAMPLLNMRMEGVDIITLDMVADVFMTDNSADIYANVNGSNGVILTIQKQTGYSTGDVTGRLLDKYGRLMEEDERIDLITFMNQGVYIDLVTGAIFKNIIFGALLAVLFLAFFLRDIKPTLVIVCSIPVSLVTAVVLMYFSGVTLNIISLSGLALGVGMLLDNSIVVIENIFRLRAEGRSRTEAAIAGARQVRGAIIAATLTTVCVFAPIVFTEGITRQLFVDMGLTIGYSLAASLLVAITVVPALASNILGKADVKEEFKWYKKLVNVYEKGLRFSLKHKYVVIIPALLLLVISGLLTYSKGFKFMDDMDSPQMSLTMEFPADTLLNVTSAVTDEVVEIVRAIPEVVDAGATLGGNNMGMLLGGGMGSSSNQASVYILMDEAKKRTNIAIAAELEGLLADIVAREDIELSVQTSDMDISMLSGSGIAIHITGRELDTLQAIATAVAEIVETVPGTAAISDGSEDQSGELRVIVDRDAAIAYGLTVAQVFQQVYAKISTASSSTALQAEIRDYDVYVKHGGDLALTRETLRNLEIDVLDQDGKKAKASLSEMAAFEDAFSPNAIRRNDQTRYAQVTADIAEGYNVTLVTAAVERALAGYALPQGYELSFAGEDEFIGEAMSQLYLMLVLALLFMFLVMVAQFQSLTSPFIVMFTVPLAFTGGFLALLLSGNILSIVSLIGFVLLAGVIVNNGIVLIDFVNQLREQGLSKLDALLKGGRTRLRPVLMMAMTTILAMSMMVFSQDMGAAMSRSMALVTIGGLAYGTLMTLFVIPCIYDLFNRDKENFTENGEAGGEAKRGPKKVRAKKVKALIEEMAAVEDLDK